MYGTQPKPTPGSASIGYGPGGQIYDPSNPIAYTSSGVRPQSVVAAANRGVTASNPTGGAPIYSPSGGIVGYEASGGRTVGQNRNLPQGSGGMLGSLMGLLGGGQQQTPGYSAPNPFTQTGGSYGTPGMPSSGANINTTINPSPIYSTQQTQEATNQAMANQLNNANMPWLQQRYAQPGMSVNSPYARSLALPSYAGALAGAQQASAAIPFQDTRADAQHYLAGETGREDEALGLARILASLNSVNQGAQTGVLTTLMQLLGQFN